MATELNIAGVGVSSDVLSAIVTSAVERIEGVVQVGVTNDIASSLYSVLTAKPVAPGPSVICEQGEDGLHVTVHLTVFYGYPFTKLAETVRQTVVDAVRDQAGATTTQVDVCIDNLVFPKE